MLSSQFLISQKECCGNGCRMCPYEPRHIKGNTSLQKRWNVSEKNPYTIITVSYTHLTLPTKA